MPSMKIIQGNLFAHVTQAAVNKRWRETDSLTTDNGHFIW